MPIIATLSPVLLNALTTISPIQLKLLKKAADAVDAIGASVSPGKRCASGALGTEPVRFPGVACGLTQAMTVDSSVLFGERRPRQVVRIALGAQHFVLDADAAIGAECVDARPVDAGGVAVLLHLVQQQVDEV